LRLSAFNSPLLPTPPKTTSDRPDAATSRELILPAVDGYPLAARLWTCAEQPTTAAIINAGAGIDMRYYDRFANFLATNRVPTLVYDYRGIGQSRPATIRGFAASIQDWGSKDCAAALAWMRGRFPKASLSIVGHSVGGFVTGFVTNGNEIARMLLVGAHTGYWRDYAMQRRLGMYLMWHMFMPAVTRVFGYFPGRRLHLLDDLPAGIALEWANRRRGEFWWNHVTPAGTLDVQWRDRMLDRFLAIRAPTLALRPTDDAFATEPATARLLELYGNCPATQVVFSPDDAGVKKIGHFGFFRSRFRDTLWTSALAWLLGSY
jgi:predicted alpha/beta hydrolase